MKKEYSNIRLIIGTLFFACCLESFSHDTNYGRGGIVFALESIFENGTREDVARVVVYGLLAFMRIVFEGYGVVMLLPWLVPVPDPHRAEASADSLPASGSSKRES
jgi:hypothetical protein